MLKELSVGDHVYIQDQFGKNPRKWSKSGNVVEIMGHDSYLIKVDGSGKLTRRNRQFLRKFVPFQEKTAVINQMIGEQDVPLKLLQHASDRPLQTMILMTEVH